jgi:hypothetical protein
MRLVPTMQQTVIAQGWAWDAATRTHSTKVRYEAENIIEAQQWIKRNSLMMEDLCIVRRNDDFILTALLDGFGKLAQVSE